MKDCSPEKGMDATQIAAVVDEIMVETTLEEKVAMMSGRGFSGRWPKTVCALAVGLTVRAADVNVLVCQRCTSPTARAGLCADARHAFR